MKEKVFRLRDTPENKFKRWLIYLILFSGVAAYMADYTKRYIFFLSTLFILSLALIKWKYHHYKKYLVMRRIKRILEENFLELRIYTTFRKTIIRFPRVIIKPNEIIIKYKSSLRFKTLLEANIYKIGAVIPDGWQIKDQYEINSG